MYSTAAVGYIRVIRGPAASTSTTAALRRARPGDGAASTSSLRRLPLGFAVFLSSLRVAFLGVACGTSLASRFLSSFHITLLGVIAALRSVSCSFLFCSLTGSWGSHDLPPYVQFSPEWPLSPAPEKRPGGLLPPASVDSVHAFASPAPSP